MSDARETTATTSMRTLVIDKPKGNVVDSALCAELREQLRELAADPEARLLVVEGAGAHFSFGASVPEHLPPHAEGMLEALHGLIRDLVMFPYPTLAAVRGRCLGGGLEVALACDLMVLEDDAVLATPEIRLGVFAPSATALLTGSVPRAIAAEILLTGRDISAEEAMTWGLANRVVAPGSLADAVAELEAQHFAPRSAASLRVATRAYRSLARKGLNKRLEQMERLYLDELLPLHDGTEGISAFLEKRPPVWRHA